MRIILTLPRWETRIWLVGGVVLLWLLISLLGYMMTRQMPETTWLTHSRWQELQVRRQTQRDLLRLEPDLHQLRILSQQPYPDPVQTLALAQRVYHRYRTGVVTTTAVRHALIQAAETAVQAAYSDSAQVAAELTAALQAVDAQLQHLRSP